MSIITERLHAENDDLRAQNDRLVKACEEAVEALTCIVNPQKPDADCDCYACVARRTVTDAISLSPEEQPATNKTTTAPKRGPGVFLADPVTVKVTVKTKQYWIKERHNPQIGVYYVACGQISKTAARKMESSLYGDNVMLSFDSEAEYKKKLDQLRKDGKKVQ